MPRRSNLCLGLLLALSAASAALPAQSSFSHQTPTVLKQPLETWPQLGVDLTLIDRTDTPVATLTPQQLEVREDAKLVTSFDLVPEGDAPQSICLLVDTSGSTYSNRDIIRRSVLKLIADLPPKDELCLVDFSAEAYVDSDLTLDRDRLRRGVEFLKSSGGSAIDDALVATAKYLMKNARFRSRAIILLSDGVDNASTAQEGTPAKVLHDPGAPVVYALDNQAKPHDFSERHSGRTLQKLTTDTGGLAWSPKGDLEVDAAVTNLVQVLSHRYRLTLTTEYPRDGSNHRLDVTLNKDLRKQKMIVNTTRGFDAPLP